ncbi:hypothetical protein IBX38_08745 [Candidatus Bathyarchaeota archaeon]|nr:hypothetical protein [Candidatus Bathyarchaeota archaeon]
MLYEPNEIAISERYLGKVFRQIKGDVCLLGGWATYQIVDRNFERLNGRKYIGSRDIDIGFHIDRGWSEEQLRKSDFSVAISLIEEMGFRSVSFRFLKDFDLETGRELTPEESARLPLYRIFQLYVDPVVDYIHPKIKDIFGFVPIDEPLLSLVFADRICTVASFFGRSILLPKPQVLLAMKLCSVINRDKEHKRIKDIADIYTLLWFSDVNITKLKTYLLSIYPEEKLRETVRGFTEEEINRVSAAIGMNSDEITRVLAELR